MKIINSDLKELNKESTLRSDFRYILSNSKDYKKTIKFRELFEIISISKKDRLKLIEKIDDINFYYSEIGNISNEGQVDPVSLNFYDRSELHIDLYSKIEKGDIQNGYSKNILIAKTRPNLKKFVFINHSNKNYYYTNSFIQIKPKKINKLLYYSLRTVFFDNLVSIARQGKGYPTLKEDDLYKLKFRKDLIDAYTKQEVKLENKINKIENEIEKIESKRKDTDLIINEIILEEFKINLKNIINITNDNNFKISSNITAKNFNLRSSFRWNKIEPLQKELFSNSKNIVKLGKYILNTKNGWSPSCNEEVSETHVFGVGAISKEAVIKFNDIKYTEEIRSNMSEYLAKKNDLFISRGNTTELVALAAVVEDLNQDNNFIYPDLFIKVEIDESNINKKYLALIINSIIGRIYFKYAAKGKQQTMVKISRDELDNFSFPLPKMSEQNKIVKKIETKFKEQEKIDKLISNEFVKIEKILQEVNIN